MDPDQTAVLSGFIVFVFMVKRIWRAFEYMLYAADVISSRHFQGKKYLHIFQIKVKTRKSPKEAEFSVGLIMKHKR